MMTLLQVMLDGAVTAAELLALLLVPPAAAHDPATVAGVPASVEHQVRLHRLSTTVDVRLLGSLADVRVAQTVANRAGSPADLAEHLPAVDEHVDALRVLREDAAVDLLTDCGAGAIGGHARLSEDERIADALQLGPGESAVIEAIAAQPLVRAGAFYRVMLPARLDHDAPRAILLDDTAGPFLLLVPHRTATRSTLVLRPASGSAETLDLGALDPRHAVLVPLSDRSRLEALAGAAIELELGGSAGSWWSTLAVERATARDEVRSQQAN